MNVTELSLISSEFINYFRFSINSANLLAIFLQIPISLGNCWILLGTAFIHPNLKCILMAQSVCFCTFSISRCAQIFNVLIFGPEHFLDNFLLQSILVFSITFLNSIGHILFIERLLATILYKKYERQHRCFPSIGLLLIFIIAFSAYTTFEQVLNSDSNNNPNKILEFRLGTLISYGLIVFLAFLEIFAIFLLGTYNLKKYKLQLRANGCGEHNLSERFQTCENIRTARQLAPIFALHSANLFFINSFPFAIYFGILNGPLSIELSSEIIFFLMNCTNIGIEYFIICKHPILRRNAQKLLVKLKLLFCKFRVADFESSIQKQQNIQQRRNNEADEHFKMLKQEWA